MPDAPEHYVPRPDELEALTGALLRPNARTVAITGVGGAGGKHGIYGMGGLGKSVLAAAACREPSIGGCYADGVYWLTVGQTPDLLSLQAALARALGHNEPLDSVSDGKRLLRKLLADKAVLLVLDDVWDPVHADALEVTGVRGCVLITTRNRKVLQRGEEHCLDVLSPEQSLTLLAQWAGQGAISLPRAAAQVAEDCGRLPLALATIGAMVRADEVDWADAGELLRNADLDELEARFPAYPYPSILAAIEVSVAAMDETVQARYLDLAIFPEDEPIPYAALAVLWREYGISGAKLRTLLGKLAARSLVSRDADGRIRLHDILRMYIRQRVGQGLKGCHDRLIAAYALACPDGFGRGADDGYLFQRLSWHWAEAGRQDQLVELLCDYHWLEGKLRATSVNELIADFALIDNGYPVCRDADLLRDALRLASHVLMRDARQLPSQLIGRLGGFARSSSASLSRLVEQCRGPHGYMWLEPIAATLGPPGGPLLRTLTGHRRSVTAVAVTPDCQRVISSSSQDLQLKVWELSSGQELLTLDEGNTAVAVTPDGGRAISGSQDQTLNVWDLQSGKRLLTLYGHSSAVTAVTVTPDGQRAISASWDQTLKVWDIQSGQELRTLSGHGSLVTAVAVTPDGGRAISASEDGTLKVWALRSGNVLLTLYGHEEAVTAVAVMPDGRRVISASADRTLKVWDLASGQELLSLSGHNAVVTAVAVTPDGENAISASWDYTLKIWDLARGTELMTLSGHSGTVNAVAVMPDGRRAISASNDRTLKVWEISRERTQMPVSGHDVAVTRVMPMRDGQRAISVSNDRTLKVWELSSGRELSTPSGYEFAGKATAVMPDGQRVMSIFPNHTLKMWELSSGQERLSLAGHAQWITAVAVTPDGQRAISASADQSLKVWELQRGRKTLALLGHIDRTTAVAVTPDGEHAISASVDQTLIVWELASGRRLATLEGHDSIVMDVAVTPDGHRAISASADRMLKVWDLRSYTCLATFSADAGIPACAVDAVTGSIIAGDGLGRVHILRIREPNDAESMPHQAAPILLSQHSDTATSQPPPPAPMQAPSSNPLPNQAMPRMRILHISDLHTRGTRDGKRAWKRSQVLGDAWLRNLDDITADGRSIDLVAFTGDIADWGLAAEYKATTQFITDTLDRLGLPMDRFFVVPGNHDIDRKLAADVWAQMRIGIQSHASAVGEWLADIKQPPPFGFSAAWADALLSREQAFWDWVSRDLGRPELLPANSPHDRLGYRVRVDLPECSMPIHVIGLDTAWLAGDDGDAGQLRLTDDQLGLLCLGADHEPLPGFRLALMHHPLGDLADEPTARQRLADWTDLLLRGHQHTPLALSHVEPGRTVRELAAGCLYEGAHGHNYPNAVQVVDVALDGQGRPVRYDVRFRAWSSAGHWYDNGALYRRALDGRLSWEV